MSRKMASPLRREQIAQAALELLGEGGMADLSIGAIAERLDLVPSAIYRHFRGKEEVIDAVLDLLTSRLQGNLEDVSRRDSDAIRRLHALLALQVHLVRENRGLPRLVFSGEVCGGRRERRERLAGIIRMFLEGVAGIVRDGQRSGSVRKDADPEAMAIQFLGLVQPAALLWHLTEGCFDITGLTERAWALYLESIAPRRPRGRRPPEPAP